MALVTCSSAPVVILPSKFIQFLHKNNADFASNMNFRPLPGTVFPIFEFRVNKSTECRWWSCNPTTISYKSAPTPRPILWNGCYRIKGTIMSDDAGCRGIHLFNRKFMMESTLVEHTVAGISNFDVMFTVGQNYPRILWIDTVDPDPTATVKSHWCINYQLMRDAPIVEQAYPVLCAITSDQSSKYPPECREEWAIIN